MDGSRVQLWAKTDPFLLGALQMPPPAKFSMHYLRKMASYVRTRATEGCYPRLYWAMWRHIACGKLQIVEETAWLYFETFLSVFERSVAQSLDWAEVASTCPSSEKYEEIKSQLSVDTLKFILFLYIQQINKISLRAPMIESEWPSPRSRSPTPDFVAQSSIYNKVWDDYSHYNFIHNHLTYILELLMEPKQLSIVTQSSHCILISAEVVNALGFLIEGTVDKNRAVNHFLDLAVWQPVQIKSGFIETSGAFSFQKLQAWIKECLVINPFGITACIKSGTKLSWAQQVDGLNKRAKVACNTYKVPHTHRMVVMSQISKQTLAKSSKTLVDARVKIHRCSDCYIYLLSPLRSVTVEKCQNCTIILGPVQTVLHIQMCYNVKIIAVCQRLSLLSTTNCTFHILTPTRPLFYCGNQGAVLAPFHIRYSMLEDHMAQTGLATVPNSWDRPFLFSTESNNSNIWRLMPPEDFFTFVVPFEMEGDTTEIPGGLPPAYSNSVQQRQQKIHTWQKTVKDAGLTREQRKQFQAVVEMKFNEWLSKTENRHQLDSLVS
ncbi:TBCC domain-containing protein 1 [Xenopus laevis]|uniref:TBCC domain-containing protein 1 n=2 Tax=Xenopus laevis TaxID=8355 RepID=TBCC1_XENLA|nr:TBCC domain-containing protein 1 [Xenopus laevis]Q08AV6.1 RecName: Full=TBCC domain-containing protein 1 [Xenopus laevis]AAI24992.1 Tbccd1 protein [Xenopus laevis]OCT63944.1 hypothetical protein XELAEV_18045040mg [Xenopus laevis]